MGGPCDFSVSPSPFGLDFGTLDFGTSDLGLTIIALSRSRLVKNVLVIEFNDMLQLSRRGDPRSRR